LLRRCFRPRCFPLARWLALTLTEGLGPTRSKRLVEPLRRCRGNLSRLSHRTWSGWFAWRVGSDRFYGKSLDLAQQEMVKVADSKADIVTLDDPRYPQRLREICHPPLVLYVRGSVELLSLPRIAVVGTRHPTPYGVGMAERLACDLSNQGVSIISGLARGVGTAAHGGVISAQGRTVGVMGTGVDRHRHPADAAEFSDSESHQQRNVRGGRWLSRLRSTAERGLRRGARWSKAAKSLPYRAMRPTKMHGVRTP